MDPSTASHEDRSVLSRERKLPLEGVGTQDTPLGNGIRYDDGKRKVRKPSFPRGQSPSAWLVKKYVDLDDYSCMLASGEVTRLVGLPDDERLRRFGSLIVPIFVPLARGETHFQYEDQFKKWLRSAKGMSLEQLQRRASPYKERSYWIKYSYVAVKSNAHRGPERKERVSELPPWKTPLKAVASQAKLCCGSTVLADAIACGCDGCLTTGMQQLARRIEGLGTEKTRDDKGNRLDFHRDPVEFKLLEEYDKLNAEIELNEAVLEASSAELASTRVHDIKKTVEIQDENEELRRLLPEERRRRSKTLARVVLYEWRHEIHDLKTALQHKNALNSLYIQRKCHQKTTRLAVALAEKLSQLEVIERETPQSEDSLRSLRREIEELRAQRRHQFQTLLHVDQQLRETVWAFIQHGLVAGQAGIQDVCGPS